MADNTNFPITFTRTLQHLCLSTKSTAVGLGVAGLLMLPLLGLQPKGLQKLLAASIGVTVAAVGWQSYRDNKQLQSIGEDLGVVERKQSISWYSSLLSHRPLITVQTPETPTAITQADIITDVVEYWRKADKHLLIVAGTGAGKSTFIQSFASCLGASWHYKIYDSDCTVDDWAQFRQSPNASLYESFTDIEQQMQLDLQELETRTSERKAAGNTWQPKHTFIVAEELPALADECDSQSTWIRKVVKRGRRVKLFVAAVVQNDTAGNLGLEGDIKLRDNSFVRVYLGSTAVDRAKQLKNPVLAQWLTEGGYGVCLVDDKPCLRPQTLLSNSVRTTEPEHKYLVGSESEVSEVHNSKASSESGTTENSSILANSDHSESTSNQLKQVLGDQRWKLLETQATKTELQPAQLVSEIRRLTKASYSQTAIIRELWDATGGSVYTDAKALLIVLADAGLLN